MKYGIIWLTACLVAGLALWGCDDDEHDGYRPDGAIERAFEARFPAAGHVEWSSVGSYEKAEFVFGGRECEAWFASDATWLLTETDLSYAGLPQAVKQGFMQSAYAGWTVDDAGRLERLGMATLYELEAERAGEERVLWFDESGRLVRETTETPGGNVPAPLPASVRDFITETYPSAVIVYAGKLTDGRTEVDILDGDRIKAVFFLASGDWEYTQWEVPRNEVPSVVLDVLDGEAYAGYGIGGIEYRVYPQQEYYRIELEKPGSLDMIVRIDPQGNLLLG